MNRVRIGEDNFFYPDMECITKKSSKASMVARQKGNKLYMSNNHNKKIHLDILSHYSESVAFAEDGSKEMALAYSNRSALLLHLHKYQECLVDIERAYQITKLDELKMKLMTRKMKCMKLMDDKTHLQVNDKNNEIETIESLTTASKRSKTIPCAYNCVTLASNDEHGRHLVATKDIDPGQVVVMEKILVQFPSREKTYLVCSHCLMFACNGMPCKSCAEVIYCSEKCKNEAWLQYHDVECVILPFLNYANQMEQSLTEIILAIRLFITLVKREGLLNVFEEMIKVQKLQRKGKFLQGFYKSGVFQSNKMKTVFNLMTNPATYVKKKWPILVELVNGTVDLLADNTNIFYSLDQVNAELDSVKSNTVKLICKLILIIETNSFKYQGSNCICESLEECNKVCGELDIGSFFSPFCSLVNHSCSFNVIHTIIDDQMVLYAVQPIKKGEQLFISYYQVTMQEVPERRKVIKESHNFICNCTACTENWPVNLILDAMKDFDNISKLTSEIEKVETIKGIKLMPYTLFNIHNDWVFNKSVKDAHVEIMKIIYKYCTGCNAYMHSFYHMTYISRYFEVVFGKKVFEIPQKC